MSEEKHKEYSNGEITVIWKPELCVHSGICVKHSPTVFRPKERPWIKIEAAASNEIMRTVEQCPSGALSYRIEKEKVDEPKLKVPEGKTKIEMMKNGPMIVFGEIEIKDSDGTIKTSTATTVALCRCGASKDKPFCDGSHGDVKFEG